MTSRIKPITVSALIPADPETVFSFIADTRNDPTWCPNVSDVSQTAGDGVEVGARFRFHQVVEAGGRTLKSDVDVEVIELGEWSIRWRVEDRFQIRDVLVEVSAADGGSKVTQTTTAEFKRKPGMATRWTYPRLARRTFKDQFHHLVRQFG